MDLICQPFETQARTPEEHELIQNIRFLILIYQQFGLEFFEQIFLAPLMHVVDLTYLYFSFLLLGREDDLLTRTQKKFYLLLNMKQTLLIMKSSNECIFLFGVSCSEIKP